MALRRGTRFSREEPPTLGHGYRGCPWGFNSQAEWYWYEWFPGTHADVQWYFRPYAIGDGFQDFGDGWTEAKANLWRTDVAVDLGSYTFSRGQFLNGTITDPTRQPPGDQSVGYGSNEGSGGNYVVA